MNKVLDKVSRIARLLAQEEQPALLSTIGIDGSPRSRYMGAFRIKEEGEIFLISPSKANKMQEIRRNSLAQVILASKDCQRVLTLSGKAAIVEDMALRRSLFEETKPLRIYPVFDDNFGVIHFVSLRAEYLDLKICNSPYVFKIPRES